MKKLIIATLILLLPTVCFAGALQEKLCGVIAKKNTSAPTCSVDTNEVGRRDEDASTLAGSNNNMYCHLHTPDCSGKLYTAYLRHSSEDAENAKVCVYLDDGDSEPDSDDSLVECSGAIASGSSKGWKNAAMATNPAVSTGSNYWVCLLNENSTTWDSYYVASGVRRQRSCSGCYASPPATLDYGSWLSGTSTRDMYVTIGD